MAMMPLQFIHTELSLKQKLLFSRELQHSLEILEVPYPELKNWLDEEALVNPFLVSEENHRNFPRQKQEDGTFFSAHENIAAQPSMSFSLLQQARELFSKKEDLLLAETIIGSLDPWGYLEVDPEQLNNPHFMRILSKIKEKFDPPGIATSGPREYLLFQLEHKRKKMTLAYTILSHYCEDLLAGRWMKIANYLNSSPKELQKRFKKEVVGLNPHPYRSFSRGEMPPIIPDVTLSQVEGTWLVEINEKEFPSFAFSKRPLLHEKEFFSRAKWLKSSLEKRRATLEKLSHYIVKKTGSYLNGDTSSFAVTSVKEAAHFFGMHPSTIFRAISQKWLAAPRGLFPLSLFLSSSLSAAHIQEEIRELLSKENGVHFTDQEIAQSLKARGISISRRCAAKYRKAMQIPSSFQR